MTATFRPLEYEDVIAVNGEPFKESVRGIAVLEDGEPVMIGGVLHTKPLQAFSECIIDPKKYPVTVMKATRAFKKIIEGYRGPVYAIASTKYPTSESYLKHTGFEYVETTRDGRLYQWVSQ